MCCRLTCTWPHGFYRTITSLKRQKKPIWQKISEKLLRKIGPQIKSALKLTKTQSRRLQLIVCSWCSTTCSNSLSTYCGQSARLTRTLSNASSKQALICCSTFSRASKRARKTCFLKCCRHAWVISVATSRIWWPRTSARSSTCFTTRTTWQCRWRNSSHSASVGLALRLPERSSGI